MDLLARLVGPVDASLIARKRLALTIGTGVGPLSNIVFGLVRAKVTATILGPTGAAVIGQLGTLVNLANFVAQWGMPTGVVAEIGRARARGEAGRTPVMRSTFFVGTLLLTIPTALALIALHRPVARLLFGAPGHEHHVLTVVLGVAVAALGTAFATLLVAENLVSSTVVLGVAAGLLSTAQTVVLTWLYGLNGAVWALVGNAVAAAAVAFVICRRHGIRVLRDAGAVVDPAILKTLLKWGSVGTITSVAIQLSDATVKGLVIRNSGLETAGVFQAALNLSFQYMSFLLGSLPTFLFPQLAGTRDRRMVVAECNVSLRVVLAIGAPVLVTISLIARPVLSTLYAPEFTAGASLLAVIVVADALKIPAKILGTLIVARGHVAAWLIADIGFSLMAPLSVVQAYRHLGPLAAPVGVVLSTLLALGFFWLSARSLEGFRMTGQNVATVAVLVLGLVALAASGPELSLLRLTMAAATVAAVEGLALGRGGLRRLVARD